VTTRHSTTRRSSGWLVAGLSTAALVWALPSVVGAADGDGFDGYIQSGTCTEPTDALRVQLDGHGPIDIVPYEARTGVDDETVVLGYYGSPGVPGFGFSAIYTDEPYSLVITPADSDEPVACGEILEPDRDRFAEAGVAVVQLLPTDGSTVQGVALVDRLPLERELDATPTRVRVILSAEADVTATAAGEGYDGHIENGTCDAPGNRVRTELKSWRDRDVMPFLARVAGSDDPVTVAYSGSPLAPGFGLAAAHTDQQFSLVISDGDTAFACGDILEPADDEHAEAGVALVQLRPAGDGGGDGYAVIERIGMERETDVIPTRVRVVLFAPPIDGG
jgi:hypothetical protein